MRALNIAPDSMGGTGGGGHEAAPRYREFPVRSHGFIALAFGFALGITVMILFALIYWSKPDLPQPMLTWIKSGNFFANLGIFFLWGFIGGTLISAIYNCLVYRKLVLFGVDRTLD